MKIGSRPLIGIILDEDTSNGGRFYQTNKGYFRAIYEAGGAPIALPYEQSSVEFALDNCQGLMSTGARIKFPDEFYIDGEHSVAPFSDRFEIEAKLIKEFVEQDRPYFGICNGMQILGALYGARMTYQLKVHQKGEIDHNLASTRHKVEVLKETKLAQILGVEEIITNSHHNEAILQPSESTLINAYASDGTIEGLEIKGKTFALGVQWHPELLWPNPNDANDNEIGNSSKMLFSSFVQHCI